MYVIITSFLIIFLLQYLLCAKTRSKKLHFLPICAFIVSSCVFAVLAHVITGWDALAYIVFAIASAYAAAVCGVTLVIFYFVKKRK